MKSLIWHKQRLMLLLLAMILAAAASIAVAMHFAAASQALPAVAVNWNQGVGSFLFYYP